MHIIHLNKVVVIQYPHDTSCLIQRIIPINGCLEINSRVTHHPAGLYQFIATRCKSKDPPKRKCIKFRGKTARIRHRRKARIFESVEVVDQRPADADTLTQNSRHNKPEPREQNGPDCAKMWRKKSPPTRGPRPFHYGRRRGEHRWPMGADRPLHRRRHDPRMGSRVLIN